MRPAVPSDTLACCAEYAPMTLLPSPVPVTIVEQAKSLQKDFNVLMHKVAHDHAFLEMALEK